MANQLLDQIAYQAQLLALNAMLEAARRGKDHVETAQTLDSIDVLVQSLRNRRDVTVIDLDQMDDLQRCYQAVLYAADN